MPQPPVEQINCGSALPEAKTLLLLTLVLLASIEKLFKPLDDDIEKPCSSKVSLAI